MKNKKNILLFIEAWLPYKGGGQIHTKFLVDGLIKNFNCRVTLVTRKLKINNKYYISNESQHNGLLKIYRIGLATDFDNIIGKLSWVFKCIIFTRKKEYDIVHAMPNLGAMPGKLVSISKNIPIIFSIQGSTFHNKILWYNFIKRVKHWILLFVQTKVNYNAIISDSSKINSYLKNRNLFVIHNGIELKMFKNNKIRINKIFKLLFIGRLHEQKGLPYLIEAIKKNIDSGQELDLTIVGEGSQKGKLLSLVNDFNLNENVFFIGEKKHSELPKIYNSADLYVLPSLFEGQPISLLEAWGAKLPVLVTDCGENSKMVDNDVNGWIVPIRDSEALATAISYAMSMSKKDLLKIGLNGYNKVLKNYTWEKTIKNIYDVYNQSVD